MKIQTEISILEKSVLVGLIENCIKEYIASPKPNVFDKTEALKVVSQELEKIKELNLISFYGVSSHVNMEIEHKQ